MTKCRIIQSMILLLVLKRLQGLLKNDVVFENQNTRGKILIQFGVSKTYQAGKGQSSLCSYSYYYKCKLLGFYRICSLKDDTVHVNKDKFKRIQRSNLVKSYGYDFFNALNEPSFAINKNGTVFDINSDLFDCEPVFEQYHSYAAGSGDIEFSELIRDIYYSNKLHITIITFIEHLYKSNNKRYSLEYLNRKVFMIPTSDCNNKFQKAFKPNYFVTLKCRWRCAHDYYKSKCWYKCTENTNETCVCQKVNNIDTCNTTCKAGFLKTRVKFKVNKKIEMVEKCNIVDNCRFHACSKQLCLPIYNGSYICEPKPSYEIKNQGGLEAVDYLFINDKITVKLKGLSRKIKKTTKRIYIFLNPHSDQVLSKAFNLEKRYQFIVTNYSKIDELVNLTFMVYFDPWDKLIDYYKSFRVYQKPENTFIVYPSSKNYYLLVNSKLTCISSVKPSYRALYFWSSENDTLDGYINSETKIKSAKTHDSISIKCSVFLIVAKTKILQDSVVLRKVIKEFNEIKWFRTENELDLSTHYQKDQFTCNGKPDKVISLIAPNKLDWNKIIYTYDLTKGFYVVFCFAQPKDMLFKRISRFAAKDIPKTACFVFFPHIFGSIVQCAHDGFYQSDYFVKISLFKADSNIKLAQSYNYMRLPVFGTIDGFVVSCDVVSRKTDETIVSTEINTTVKMVSEYTYDIDNSTIYCSTLIKPFEVFGTSNEYQSGRLKVNQFVYTSDVEKSVTNDVMMLLIITVFLSVSLLVSLIGIILSEDQSRHSMIVTSRKLRKKLTKGNIQNRLNEEVTKYQDVKLMASNALFRSSYFKKSQESSG